MVKRTENGVKVIRKQRNSRMCVVCGMENPFGLQAQFYTMEDESVCTLFSFAPHHQSYPGRVHGGLIGAMLDELGFRAFWIHDEETLGVTMSLGVKYRRPVPYGVPLKGIGRIVRRSPRFVRSHAEILDMEGNVLASADIDYIVQSAAQITEADYHAEMHYLIEDDVREIE